MKKLLVVTTLFVMLTTCEAATPGTVPAPPASPTRAPAERSQPLHEGSLLAGEGAGGCGRILFLHSASNDEIKLKTWDMDGQVDLITSFETTDWSAAAWSPKASFIAFTAKTPASPFREELFVVRADGSGRRRLTRGSSLDLFLSWSPDERQIVVRDVRHRSILVVDVRGRQRELARGSAPQWSPDGRWIAFSNSGPEGGSSLTLIRPDGSSTRVLAAELGGRVTVEGWSPDSQFLLFTVKDSSATRLWRSDLHGDLRLVDTGPAAGIDAAEWAPDGRRIAFVRKADEQGAIKVTAPNGITDPRSLTEDCCYDAPDWAPNGNAIVFESLHGLQVVDLRSGGRRPLVGTASSYVYNPDWAPC